MSAASVTTTRSPIRRTVASLALLAAVGAGTGVVALEHGTAGKPGAMPAQCWYKGWFKEGGVWYYGYFKEAC